MRNNIFAIGALAALTFVAGFEVRENNRLRKRADESQPLKDELLWLVRVAREAHWRVEIEECQIGAPGIRLSPPANVPAGTPERGACVGSLHEDAVNLLNWIGTTPLERPTAAAAAKPTNESAMSANEFYCYEGDIKGFSQTVPERKGDLTPYKSIMHDGQLDPLVKDGLKAAFDKGFEQGEQSAVKKIKKEFLRQGGCSLPYAMGYRDAMKKAAEMAADKLREMRGLNSDLNSDTPPQAMLGPGQHWQATQDGKGHVWINPEITTPPSTGDYKTVCMHIGDIYDDRVIVVENGQSCPKDFTAMYLPVQPNPLPSTQESKP